MQKIWTTRSVPAPERLAYWIEDVCQTYVQLDCDARAPEQPFEGRIESSRVATLGLSRVTAAAQHVRRTPAKIAQATEDFFLVSIQTGGHGRVSQDGRIAELAPGDFALYDSTRPYDLEFDHDFQQYVLQLPGAVLRSRLRDADRLTARRVGGDRGAGHLLIGMIDTLAADVDTLAPASATAIAEGVENILVAGLCALPGAADPAISRLAAYHRTRIKSFVLQHLRDPELSIDAIAAHLNLSPSSIHRAFGGEPVSLQVWIRERRLDAVRRDLCDPALAARSISAIAFGWGFNDAAHFSRAFRSRFGCSARTLRAEIGSQDGGAGSGPAVRLPAGGRPD